MRSIQMILGSVPIAVLGLGTGCSKLTSQAHVFTHAPTSTPMVVEGGQATTTKQAVSVEFPEYSKIGAAPTQIGEESHVKSTGVSGRFLEPKMQVDLGPAWASDGSQDGIKTITAQISTKTIGMVTASGQIRLDTLAPRLSHKSLGDVPVGLLALGLPQGEVYAPGKIVLLEWNGVDPSYPGRNESSGLASFSLGWTRASDCSPERMSWVVKDQAYANRFDAFAWPQVPPAEAFYICVVASDFAGNSSTLLSQPMGSSWRVIAGDNNPGNGGSVTASNVRFNFPGQIVVDSSKNIYINDQYAHTLRKVSADGVISLYAGNGRIGSFAGEVDAATTFLPDSRNISIDSKNRIYLINSSGIYRISPPVGDQPARIKRWLSLSGGSVVNLTVDRSDPSGDTLYLSRFDVWNPVDKSLSYIFKLNIAEMDTLVTQGTTVDYAYLLANAVYAGNGNGALSTDTSFHATPAPRAATDSVNYVYGLGVGAPGELFFSTSADGNSLGLGRHQVRLLKKDADGVLKNYLIVDGPKSSVFHVTEFLYLPAGAGETSPQLLVGGRHSSHLFKITGWNTGATPSAGSVTVVNTSGETPVRSLPPQGLALVPGSLPDGSDSRVIASEPYRAKVNVLGRADLKIQSSWGRAVYDPLATSATESMINSPLGLTEGENGMIYFFDGLNNVIRKVDPNGQISWVAGHPGAPRVAGPDLDRLNGTTPVSFADAFLDGTQYTIGYRLHLHYMSGTHSLILGDGNTGRIRSLNLDQKLIRSPLMGTNRWSVWGLAVTPPGAATQGIVASRYRPSGLFASQIFWTSLADDANSTRMIGNDNPKCTDTRNPYCSPLEAPVPGVAINSNLSGIVIATAMDTEMNYYFADPGRGAILATATTPAVPAVPSGFYKIDQAGNLTRFLSGTSIQSIALFEDADGSKHFFSSDGSERLKYFSIAAGTGVATAPKALCLPGAYLNSAFYLAPTTGVHERNLLISDTKNNRILKYYIRDSKGDLALNFNASCK